MNRRNTSHSKIFENFCVKFIHQYRLGYLVRRLGMTVVAISWSETIRGYLSIKLSEILLLNVEPLGFISE